MFDAPGWDAESTERYRMPLIADIYAAHGRDDLAYACRERASQANLFADGYSFELLSGLDDLGIACDLYDRSAGAMMQRAGRKRPNPEASARAGLQLLNDVGMFESLTPLLSELTMPTRLIVGEADLVTSPTQVEAFTRQFGPQCFKVFERAGHFVQGEQPEQYARFVLDFIAEVEEQRTTTQVIE